MINVMIDLETLGRAPGCKVLSVGAVAFGPEGLGEKFYVELDRGYQGLLVEDPETLRWWHTQPLETAHILHLNNPNAQRLRQGLRLFNQYLLGLVQQSRVGEQSGGDREQVVVWGNGAGFDQPILEAALTSVNLPVLWKYWNTRCFRTLRRLAVDIRPVEFTGTQHNALDDAVNQATHAIAILSDPRFSWPEENQ